MLRIEQDDMIVKSRIQVVIRWLVKLYGLVTIRMMINEVSTLIGDDDYLGLREF